MDDKRTTAIEMSETATAWYGTAVRVSVIAALFCLFVSGILFSNHMRLEKINPVNSKVMAQLKKESRKNPKDQKIIQKIRTLDAETRTEYFRRLNIARQGSWILIWGIAVFLIATPAAIKLKKPIELPVEKELTVETARVMASYGRKSVAAVGILALVSLGAFAAVSKHDLVRAYAEAVREYRPPVEQKDGSVVASAPAQAPQLAQATPAQAAKPGAPTPPPAVGPLPTIKPLPIGVAIGTQSTGTAPAQAAPKEPPFELVAFDANDYFPAAADFAANWPMFRGPSNAGLALPGDYPTTWDGAKGTNILWKTQLAMPGENSPVVWGDKVFLTGATDKAREIYCYDTNSGKLLWKHEAENLSKAEAPRVLSDTGYAASTLAVDGRRVFAIFATGDVVCCDFDGKRVWARNLGTPDNNYGHATSLNLYKSLLIVQFDQGLDESDNKSAIIALQAGTGKGVWRTKRPVPNSWSSPIVVNTGQRDEIITTGNPWVIGYDPMSGSELWRANCLGGDIAPCPIFAGGTIFATNIDSHLAAIRIGLTGDITSNGILWQVDESLPSITSPSSNGELVFTVTSEGLMTCWDAKDGKKIWEHDYETSFKASPVIAGSRMYALDGEGIMHIISVARTFKEEGKASLGEQANATPAFIGNRIYIRGVQNLYCIGKK